MGETEAEQCECEVVLKTNVGGKSDKRELEVTS